MRIFTALILALTLATTPAFALTITARVVGGPAAIYQAPNDDYAPVGRIAEGTEVPVDECTQIDSDSAYGKIGDAGYALWGNTATQYCHIPETGWVRLDALAGRGLVNVTPPDFAGPGW